jgi:hypothetical protein
MYIFLGNLLMGVAIVIALVFGGGQFVTALLNGESPELNWMDFLFPAALLLTGFVLQFCSIAKHYFIPVIEELFLAGSLFLYVMESLEGGLTWWLAPLREYINSTLLYTATGSLLPVILVVLMASLVVKMLNMSALKTGNDEPRKEDVSNKNGTLRSRQRM